MVHAVQFVIVHNWQLLLELILYPLLQVVHVELLLHVLHVDIHLLHLLLSK